MQTDRENAGDRRHRKSAVENFRYDRSRKEPDDDRWTAPGRSRNHLLHRPRDYACRAAERASRLMQMMLAVASIAMVNPDAIPVGQFLSADDCGVVVGELLIIDNVLAAVTVPHP